MEWLNLMLDALKSTWKSIVDNWSSFLVLIVLYTVLIGVVFKMFYKRKEEYLNYLQNEVNNERQKILDEQKQIEQIKKENEILRAEIESQEYQAYLLSRDLESAKLDDSEMFCKK